MAGAEVQRKTLRREAAPPAEAAAARHTADSSFRSARVRQLQATGALLNDSPRAIAHRALGASLATRRHAALPPKPSRTGLPDRLKSGIEALSGLSMNHVTVHYNSAKPAQLRALAYAQGSTIHLGSGQERHLPHEAWHVVQQARGQVRPTTQLLRGVAINDETGLEREADRMGARAAALVPTSAAAVPDTVRPQVHVMQLRPADIVMSYSVPFHYDAATDKDSYGGFRGQRTPHAAQPINSLRKSGAIRTEPDQDFIGGHLLKAEYGGADSPKNVVPWSAKAERTFSGYEAGYLKNIKRYRQFAQQQGKVDAEGNWIWPFYTAAEFKEWEGGGDEQIQHVLSAIPSAVTVNPGSTSDFFHITGTDISGGIKVLGGGAVDHEDAPALEAAAVSIPVSTVEGAKSKFKQNLMTCVSRVKDYAEETKHDSFGGKIIIFAMTQLEAMKEGLLHEIGNIVDQNRQPVAVAPVVHMRTVTHFISSYRSGPSEHARREALDNPIALSKRTEGSMEKVIDEAIARYRQILVNNLILLGHAMADEQPEARKDAMRGFIEECFA